MKLGRGVKYVLCSALETGAGFSELPCFAMISICIVIILPETTCGEVTDIDKESLQIIFQRLDKEP